MNYVMNSNDVKIGLETLINVIRVLWARLKQKNYVSLKH